MPKSPTGPGRIAFFIFAGITGLRLLLFAIGFVAHLPHGAYQAVQGLQGLATFVGVIFFLVWLYRATSALRAKGEQTKFSPGMAVGGWFIPFGNFVLPALSLADVHKRSGAPNGWLVPVWWISYLMTIVFNAAGPMLFSRLYGVPLIGYLPFVANLAAYGCWAYILFLHTREESAGAPVPA